MSTKINLRWIDAAGVGACVLISAIGYAALVGPFLQRQTAAADLSCEQVTRQKKLAELEASITGTQERLALAQKQLADSAIQLDSATHINKRIAGVTEFFSECALHVDDVRTGSVSGGKQYDLVPITILGRGTYPQCVKLLHGLCAKYPDMSIMHIEMTGTPSEKAETEKFRFELFWYAAPGGPVQKAAAPAADRSPVS